jgi:dTDP-4-amino-4,6-dideoxygalactose transaminase
MWKVPLFDISFDETELEAVQAVIRSGWLTMGEMTKSFERSFAEFIGTRHAIAVSSGTAALHLANLALGLSKEDEVICPSLSFVAGANSIVYVGARPVFADITSYDNFNISSEDIEAKITKRTKAIQVVHYAGHSCDMAQISEIAKKYGLYIVEDCAHAPGAENDDEKCGSIGDIGCFSFFSNKNITTAEGGMVTTDSDELAEKIKLIRSHGMTTLTLDRHKGHAFSYDVVDLGFNFRIDEVRSGLGIVQLKKLQDGNNMRQKLAQIYKERFADIEGVYVPFTSTNGVPSYHIYPVLLGKNVNREKLMIHLKDKGIQTSIHYPPIHKFHFYRNNLGYKEALLPLTEDVANREVTLPLYSSMGSEAIHYVCDSIKEYLEKGELLQ